MSEGRFVMYDPSKSIENLADDIGKDLKRITDEIITNKHEIEDSKENHKLTEDSMTLIWHKFDDMNKKVDKMLNEVSKLRKKAQKNSEEIQILLNKKFTPIDMMRAASTDTVPYSSSGEFKTKF